jgi:homoserine O-acetyltransferase
VETYLVHQGRKLVARFEAMSYLTQIGAMDHHDLARPPPAPDPHESWRPGGGWGTLRITASSLAVGIDSDVLFPPARMAELASTLAAAGRHAEYRVLSSPHGHDAFLIEWDQVGAILRRALELPRPSPGIGSGE